MQLNARIATTHKHILFVSYARSMKKNISNETMSKEREVEHFNAVIVSKVFSIGLKWAVKKKKRVWKMPKNNRKEKRKIEKSMRARNDWLKWERYANQTIFCCCYSSSSSSSSSSYTWLCRWKVCQSVISVVDVASFQSATFIFFLKIKSCVLEHIFRLTKRLLEILVLHRKYTRYSGLCTVCLYRSLSLFYFYLFQFVFSQ